MPDIADYIPSLPEIPQIQDPSEEIEKALDPSTLIPSQEQIDQSLKAIIDSVDTTQLTDILLNAPSPDITKLDLSDMTDQQKTDVIREALCSMVSCRTVKHTCRYSNRYDCI